MLVKDLKKQLEKLDDDDELKIVAPNAPPYILEFRIVPVVKKDE